MHQVPFTGYLRVFQLHSFTFSSCCSWTCCCDSLKEKLLSSLACALPAAIVHAQIPCASCCLNVHSPWNPLVTVVGPLSLPYRAYLLCYIYLSLSVSLCALISLSPSLSLSVRLCFVWHLLVYFRWRLLLSKVLLLVMCSTLWTANVWPLSSPTPAPPAAL